MQLLKICLLLMLVGLAGCESRQEAIRRQRAAAVNNLKQIGLALHNYHAEENQPAAEMGPDKNDLTTAPKGSN